jgi:hypothetical protein
MEDMEEYDSIAVRREDIKAMNEEHQKRDHCRQNA